MHPDHIEALEIINLIQPATYDQIKTMYAGTKHTAANAIFACVVGKAAQRTGTHYSLTDLGRELISVQSRCYDMPKLTDKQERFCQEYIKDFNGTRAAIAAGYSANTATVIASENLMKPYISDRIAELAKTAIEAIGVDVQDCLRVLREILEDSELKPADRIRAIELLMRYHGAFEKDNTQKSQAITFTMQVEGQEPEID